MNITQPLKIFSYTPKGTLNPLNNSTISPTFSLIFPNIRVPRITFSTQNKLKISPYKTFYHSKVSNINQTTFHRAHDYSINETSMSIQRERISPIRSFLREMVRDRYDLSSSSRSRLVSTFEFPLDFASRFIGQVLRCVSRSIPTWMVDKHRRRRRREGRTRPSVANDAYKAP